MTFEHLIRTVIDALTVTSVPYMITGSVASSFYGEPRATRDLDVVIDPEPIALRALVGGLQADGFYVELDTALEAFAHRAQFNAIGPDALKVDFVLRKDRPFSIQEFERRVPADLLGIAAFVPSVEDLIVAKLEWAVTGPSELQLRDVAGMIAIAGDRLDLVYLLPWIRVLGLEDAWRRVTNWT